MPLSLPLVRSTVLGVTNSLALLVLGLAAYTLAVATGFTFSGLAVATAVLHWASVIPMIIIGRIRNGAFTSKVYFEVAWLSFLCVMWLATGAQTAATFMFCTPTFCAVTQTIIAFSFIIWLILLGYIITLVTAAIRAGLAGNNAWLLDVKDVPWALGPTSYEKSNINSPNPTVATYPPGSNPNHVAPPVTPSPVTPQPQFNHGAPPVSPHPQPYYGAPPVSPLSQPNHHPYYSGNPMV